MKTRIEMVSLSKQRGSFSMNSNDIEGSLKFESEVDQRLERLESGGCSIVDVKYEFAVEKNAYIYTAMIVYRM